MSKYRFIFESVKPNEDGENDTIQALANTKGSMDITITKGFGDYRKTISIDKKTAIKLTRVMKREISKISDIYVPQYTFYPKHWNMYCREHNLTLEQQSLVRTLADLMIEHGDYVSISFDMLHNSITPRISEEYLADLIESLEDGLDGVISGDSSCLMIREVEMFIKETEVSNG